MTDVNIVAKISLDSNEETKQNDEIRHVYMEPKSCSDLIIKLKSTHYHVHKVKIIETCGYFKVLEEENVVILPDDMNDEEFESFLTILYNVLVGQIKNHHILPRIRDRTLSELISIHEKCIYFDCEYVRAIVEEEFDTILRGDKFTIDMIPQIWIDLFKITTNTTAKIIRGICYLIVADSIVKFGDNPINYIDTNIANLMRHCAENKINLIKVLNPLLCNAIMYNLSKPY